jgi:predicted porin
VPSLKTNGDRNAPNFPRHSLGGVKYESIGPITFGRAASIGPATAAKPFKNTRRLV